MATMPINEVSTSIRSTRLAALRKRGLRIDNGTMITKRAISKPVSRRPSSRFNHSRCGRVGGSGVLGGGSLGGEALPTGFTEAAGPSWLRDNAVGVLLAGFDQVLKSLRRSADRRRLVKLRLVGGGRGDSRCRQADFVLVGVLPVELGNDLAVPHHHDAVAGTDQFRHVGGDEQDRQALLGQFGDDPVDFGFGLNVDALGGLVEDEQPRVGRQPFGQHHLLLVAAGQRADRLIEAGELQLHPLQGAGDQGQFETAADHSELGGLGDHRQGGVVQDGEVLDDALPAPVLGDIGDAVCHGVRGRSGADRLVAQGERTGGRLVDTEDHPGDLGPSAAHQAGQADHLACPDREARRL